MFERLSEWMSATSFAMRRVRLDDMAGCDLKDEICEGES